MFYLSKNWDYLMSNVSLRKKELWDCVELDGQVLHFACLVNVNSINNQWICTETKSCQNLPKLTPSGPILDLFSLPSLYFPNSNHFIQVPNKLDETCKRQIQVLKNACTWILSITHKACPDTRNIRIKWTLA